MLFLQVCQNARFGDVVPNPNDCSSYFVCAAKPDLQKCDAGLHYDRQRRVCNWPQIAQCKLYIIDGNTLEPLPGLPIENNFNPIFLAIDTETGEKTFALAKYNPEHIECRHFGAYFLPHPRNCQRYFICAYGHLLQHECGPNTRWNFQSERCEVAEHAVCYANVDQPSDDYATTVVSSTTSSFPSTTAAYPPTVCYPVYSTYPPTTPQTSTAIPTVSHAPTTTEAGVTTSNTTWYPTGSGHTRTTWETTETTPLTVPTTTAAARVDSTIPVCPSKYQAYLAHPSDSSKYYICIVGIPVLTNCPEGYIWNPKSEFCDESK